MLFHTSKTVLTVLQNLVFNSFFLSRVSAFYVKLFVQVEFLIVNTT